MAEQKELILSLRITGTKAQEAALTTLKRRMLETQAATKNLRQSTKNNISAQKAAASSFKKLELQLKQDRVAYNQLNKQIAINNGVMKKTSGLTKGVAAGFKTVALQFIGVMAAFALVKNVIGIFKDFQQANADLAAVLGKSRNEIKALTEDAKRLGASTVFTATQVSKLQKEFAKLGFSEREILDATEATLSLAAATNTELAEAARVAGATVRGFGLDASETQRVVDVMAKSFSSSALDMVKFSTAMGKVAPVAKAVGLSIEETTALMGTLSDAGVEASISGTSLRKIFIELARKGLSLDEALERINTSQDKLTTATELFGVRAATAGLVLAENTDRTALLEAKLNLAAGAAERMAKEQLNTLQGKLTILNSAWEGWILSIDDGDGVMTNVLSTLAEMATGLLRFASGVETATEQFDQQTRVVNNLEKNIVPLIDRHEELANKTELSKDEQIELDAIIELLAENIPIAVTEFDKYGKALGISTEAAQAFIKEQKNILKVKNKEAIEEQQEAISDLGDELNLFSLQLDKVNGKFVEQEVIFTKTGTAIKKITELTNEEIQARIDRRKEIGEEIKARDAIIAGLKGEQTEAEKLLEQQKKTTEESVGLTTSEQKAKTKEIKKAQDERTKLVEENAKIRMQIERDAIDAAIAEEIRLFNETISLSDRKVKALVSEMDIKAKLRLLEAGTINEERDAEIEAEEAKFQKELMLLTIANNATEEETAAHLARTELLVKQHENNKTKIEQDATDKRIKIAQEAGDIINSLTNSLADIFEASKQRELSAAGDNADKREKIEEKFFKKQQDLAVSQAIISGALAVLRIAADVPKQDYGIATALLIAAQIIATAAEVAVIKSESLAKGGVLKGKSHARGGIPTADGQMEFEGGEAVINKRSTAMFGRQLSAINQAGGGVAFGRGGQTPIHKFQGGSITPVPSFTGQTISRQVEFNVDAMAERIGEEIAGQIGDLRVINVVSDTTEGQLDIENTESEASFG
jgi:hypothetical protein